MWGLQNSVRAHMQECEVVPSTLAAPVTRRSAHMLMSTGSPSLCPQATCPAAPGPDANSHAPEGAAHGAGGEECLAAEPDREGEEEELWLSVFPKLVS